MTAGKRKTFTQGKTADKTAMVARSQAASPYTSKNVDGAIAHLERVLSVNGAAALFGRDYWNARLSEVARCPALTPTHHTHIARLSRTLKDISTSAQEERFAFVGRVAA
jgi:hypothetical protein